jgi:hypothetical protein
VLSRNDTNAATAATARRRLETAQGV